MFQTQTEKKRPVNPFNVVVLRILVLPLVRVRRHRLLHYCVSISGEQLQLSAMGFISRKLIPACGNMCVCCPALRPSSRRPVKRYKKLLAEIFPKSPDGPPNERKIMKLCEYASKNPIRIPKIAEFIEQRCYKELRSKHPNSIVAVSEAYCKLLYVCNDRMAYFAISLLNVLLELLDIKHQGFIHILGCKTLARFIYSQTDCSYAHNIEALVGKVCQLTRQQGEGYNHLRVASLKCVSAMIWFMTEYSYIFADFDEIIYATLDNYGGNEVVREAEERHTPHHNWVDEVVRHGTSGGNCNNMSSGCINTRHQSDIKDSSTLTREESESPEVWAQICIQKLAALAKESTTLRRVLDPMVLYFDTRRHWSPRRGMAVLILSDMTYLVKSFGNEQLILSAIIRHLDHKNIMHNTQIKGDIIQIASCLVRQQRSRAVVVEIAAINDLCRHLRKSFQATLESVGSQELNWNLSLQSSIEDCLLEIAKGVGDVHPLFDIMTILLENLPVVATAARATLGCLVVLAHIINLANINLRAQLVFPEGLLLHLLKAMVHSDAETRVLAHKVFSLVLIRSPTLRYDSKNSSESRTEGAKNTSLIASATALLEKLRREQEILNVEKHVYDAHDDMKEREIKDEERVNWIRNAPNIYKIISIIDRAATSTCSAAPDVELTILTEDQTAQLLSAFWLQVYQPDNTPSNYEAIAHSFCLMLLSLRLKKADQKGSHCFFQFCLSLRNTSLESTGMMSSCRRSLFTLAMGMLAFLGKVYHIPELTDIIKISLSHYADPFLRLGDDLQLYACQQSEPMEYCSKADQQAAASCLIELRKIVAETDNFVYDIIIQHLSKITEMNANELSKQISESFAPVDCTINADVDWEILKSLVVSEESFSLDEELPKNSSVIDGDLVSESPATDIFRLIPRMSVLPSVPEVINVGQLLESALQVAGQVAGTLVSTSPLPYGTMASQCEALGMGTRKKLSSWLGHDSLHDVTDRQTKVEMENYCLNGESSQPAESKLPLKLPPASPFDNFLKAARW